MDVVGTDKVVVDGKSCRGERERERVASVGTGGELQRTGGSAAKAS